jgi:hypothetical protein
LAFLLRRKRLRSGHDGAKDHKSPNSKPHGFLSFNAAENNQLHALKAAQSSQPWQSSELGQPDQSAANYDLPPVRRSLIFGSAGQYFGRTRETESPAAPGLLQKTLEARRNRQKAKVHARNNSPEQKYGLK